jgi:hypothetical protein
MDTATALRELGVTDDVLTQAEKDQLDRDGFLPLDGVLTPDEVAALNQRLAELSAAEGDRAGLEMHQEQGTDRLADLVNKDPGSRCASVIHASWRRCGTCSASSGCRR